MNRLFKSIIYVFLSVMTSYIVHMYLPFTFDIISKYSEITMFREILILSLMISISLVFLALFITFIIKALQHLAMFTYDVFFRNTDYTTDYKNVIIEVDENNIINKSYIEFMNGQKIPFLISRMVAPTIQEVKKENTEVKENNE